MALQGVLLSKNKIWQRIKFIRQVSNAFPEPFPSIAFTLTIFLVSFIFCLPSIFSANTSQLCAHSLFLLLLFFWSFVSLNGICDITMAGTFFFFSLSCSFYWFSLLLPIVILISTLAIVLVHFDSVDTLLPYSNKAWFAIDIFNHCWV